MLGARDLKEIPEREGYTLVLLVLDLDSQRFTLTRSISGGVFGLHDGEHSSVPSKPPTRTLADRHNAESTENLSTWLLDELSLAGARLRKNAQNATVSLSFRDLAHLSIVDETKMQSEVPPALTGRYDTKTKEVAALKLLLEDDDDSGLIESPRGRDVRRLKGAKLEVVDQLIASLDDELRRAGDEAATRDQLGRINQTIEAATDSIREATVARSDASEALSRDETRERANRLRRGQISTLTVRFTLLRQQYESDIARLRLVIEGGRLLDLFAPGPCPLCGAAQEHQAHAQIEVDRGALDAAATADVERTHALIADLDDTFRELATSNESLAATSAALVTTTRERRETIRRLDDALRPRRNELAHLMATKSELEKSLTLFERHAELQRIRGQIERESATETAAAATSLGIRAVATFSDAIRTRLAAWGYPDVDQVEYDRSAQDIKAGDQYRAAHGKGVRSILHAAFTIGLADYCFAVSHPHPGFVVLDSPLVTYRAPGEEESTEPDRDFATKFYHDLESSFDGQIIVMENTDSLAPLDEETKDVRYSKEVGVGRYGFFEQSGAIEGPHDPVAAVPAGSAHAARLSARAAQNTEEPPIA